MTQATSSGRLSVAGKQVLLDGQHFAAAKDEQAAVAISCALDFIGVDFFNIPPEANRAILEALS